MTIHTKWMELLREEAADAFHTRIDGGEVEASFIDGQIKLMIGESIGTWSQFLHSQFTCIINRHFREYGCRKVVLAFDDRRHVPRAKAITQLKRRAGVQIIEFSEGDALPNDIPAAAWKESIMNPCFRSRVIELVCANVPRLIEPPPDGCVLVIDWLEVRQYEYRDASPEPIETVQSGDVYGGTPVGEADIKFAYWMRALRCPMLVEATDGDYIPIALGLKVRGVDERIWINKAWKAGVGYQYIDVEGLYAFLQRKFHHASRGRRFGCDWWEIKLFVLLLGLSGTDFTRNLPLVSPQRMWDNLPLIIQTFDMEAEDRVHMQQCKRVVELLYAETFPRHIDVFSGRSVWSQAQASKLGARNKTLIPTDRRIVCTLRNLNFLMSYWLYSHAPEASEEYGFREDDRGVLGWAD